MSCAYLSIYLSIFMHHYTYIHAKCTFTPLGTNNVTLLLCISSLFPNKGLKATHLFIITIPYGKTNKAGGKNYTI